MIAIITEKPSVGRDIARVLGITGKKEGYMEGNGYMVTWASGHLVQLAMPEEYGILCRGVEDLPLVPDPFKLCIRKRGGTADPAAKSQLEVIKKVFSKCDGIISAMDAGREGEIIFRFIYNFLSCKKPFRRLWISSLTDRAILHGMKNLKDGKEYDGLYLSAEARSKADWLIGINASRALHYSLGEGNHSLGRVQTPTLAMVCKRYHEHHNFTAQPFWQNRVKLQAGGEAFLMKGADTYFRKHEAEKAFSRLKSCRAAKITRLEKKEVREEPPLLYDLTSLQKDANRKYGFSAEKTLSLAQSLYEKKYTTYPRTSSKYIPEDVFEEIPRLIGFLKGIPSCGALAALLSAMKLPARPVDNKKITDHHALLVTGTLPVEASKEEMRVYEMVALRMLEAFSKPCVKDVTEVEAATDDIRFLARGWRVTDPGWRKIQDDASGEDGTEGENLAFPAFREGDYLPVESCNMVQKSTKAKPLLSEADLLGAMENCGREVGDKEAREAMKQTGIGTPATRASIIETLFKRGYIEKKKNTLIPSTKGLELYKLVKDMQVADAAMTGMWEMALAKIEKTPDHYGAFLGGMAVLAKQFVDEIISVAKAENTCVQTPHICPKCRLGKITIYNKVTKCNYSKCRFTLYREICGKMLSEEEVNGLLRTGRTPLISGFKSRKGKLFNASIVLEKGGKLSFDHEK